MIARTLAALAALTMAAAPLRAETQTADIAQRIELHAIPTQTLSDREFLTMFEDEARVAAIGYCFGGTMALELARSGADVHAVVGFHSGLGTARPEDAANIKGKVLVQIGTEDALIPADQRADFEAEMRAGGVDWRMLLYGNAEHSFTNEAASSFNLPGIVYDELADKRSWRAMLDLFDETFSPVLIDRA
jgi:dienelactone hydrolase